MKKIAYDTTKMDALKIVEDSDCCLKVNAVISKTGVYEYEDGLALKSKMELHKATRTARYAKLTIGDHPESKVIMSQTQLYGGVESPYFDRNKMRATLCFDKYVTPRPFIENIKNNITNKIPIDNSIGFYYTADPTPGIDIDVNTGEKRRYDYIMRDIVIDHVVIVDKPGVRGRCTFPNCGVGVDAMMQESAKKIEVKEDVVEKRGNQWCVVHCHGSDAGQVIKCFNTRAEAEAMHRAIQTHKHDELKGDEKELSEVKPTDFEEFKKGLLNQGYTEQQAKDYWEAYLQGTKALSKGEEKKPEEPKPEAKKEEKAVEKPEEKKSEEPKQETVSPPPPPEDLSAEQLIDRSKELLAMREQKVIEENRKDRRNPM